MELKPITRKEIFLQKIIDNAAMGGSSGGVTINNQDKTITENGTYTADEGYTGLGTVTVDVQSGGDEASVLDSLIERSITELTSNAESVGSYAFYRYEQLTSVNLPEVIIVGEDSFYSDSALTFVNLPKVTTIMDSAFYNCQNLSEFYAPKLISIGTSAIRGTKITSINFPKLTSVSNGAFLQNTLLTTADFAQKIAIPQNAFNGCTNLTAVILRSETMATLSNTGAFTGTPIASGTGYIYVPSALVDTYKSATNWSTYANQFRALEDYTVDGTISGELDPTKI